MKQEFYGEDLAEYKIARAKEELDTANLLFENSRLKAIMTNFISRAKTRRRNRFRQRRK